jgi:type IV pilus assembly protein PilB
MSYTDAFIQSGAITEEGLAQVVRDAGKKFSGDIDAALVASGIPESTVIEVKSKFYNIPGRVVEPKSITPESLKYIPEDSAKHYGFAPIAFKDGILEVGIVDPENISARDALEFISAKSNTPFKLFLITKRGFDVIMGSYKGLSGEVDTALGQIVDSELDKELAQSGGVIIEKNRKIQDQLKPGEEERIVEDAPIIKIVAVILRHATEGNASDIHIENTGDKVKVRFRVDGTLHTSLVLPLNVYAGVVARIKILAQIRLDEKRKPLDGSFSATIEGRKIDFRVSTLPTYYGEKVVMRILDSERGVKPLDQLGMSPRNLAMVREALAKPYGLILITGPTGSGKSTTLYSMLNELNREKENIVSLEDPVEYHIPDVNQSQVAAEIGYTFATGLRSILRQDPNIIMVGEIRDKETAQLAIQAALTGHLVLSTLHTNNALGIIPRLVDMGIDPYLIAPTLVLAVAQRLSKKTCEESRKEVPVDEATRAIFERQFKDLPEEYRKEFSIGSTMLETVSSSMCPSGTRDRIAIYEMYKVTKEIQSIILNNPVEDAIYKAVRAKGMITMKEDALLKSIQGIIPRAEVYNFSSDLDQEE